MASLNNYYLRGPVSNNDNVFIAAQITTGNYTDLYFLYFNSQSNVYQLQSSGSTIPIVFTVEGGSATSDPIVFIDRNRFLNVGTTTNPNGSGTINTLVGQSDPAGLAVATTENINPWGLFLSGVFYQFQPPIDILYYPPARRQSNPCYPAGMSSTASTTTTFYVIPTRWYDPSQNCGFISTPTSALVNEIIWFYVKQCNPDVDLGSPSSIAQNIKSLRSNLTTLAPLISGITGQVQSEINLLRGFTRLQDCQTNIFYGYCSGTTLCSGEVSSNTGCAGPCKNGQRDSDCQIDSTQTFTCDVQSSSSGLSTGVIIAIAIGIIILFLVIAGGLAFLILWISRKKPKS